MNFGVIITALLGVVTSFCTSFTTWFFTRRKYNAQVDSATLENIEASLKLYQNIVRDLGKKLDLYGKIIDKNRGELLRIKNVVINMMGKICTVESCKNRCPYTDEETQSLLHLLDFDLVDEEQYKDSYKHEDIFKETTV